MGRTTLRIFVGMVLAAVLATAASARTVIDSAGRKVELPDNIQRVIAAGPPAQVALYTLDRDKLVGLVRPFSDAQRAFIPDKYATLPVSGSVNGHGGDNIEIIKNLKPDVIVDIGDVTPRYAEAADAVQKQLGIPCLLIDGTLARTAETYLLLGQVLNTPERAETLAHASTALLDGVSSKLVGLPTHQRPWVYYGRGKDGLTTGMAGSINLETIAAAGGINMGDTLGDGGLKPITAEHLLNWNPSVIVAQEREFYDSLRNDSKWHRLRAVAARRVYLSPAVPFGWMEEPPSVNRLLGVRWLAALLYPDRFADDLRPIIRNFYKTFYAFDLTDRQIDGFLSHLASDK